MTISTKIHNQVIIREARVDEAPAIAALAARTFRATYDDLSDQEIDTYLATFLSDDDFARHVVDTSTMVYVAVLQELVGYALVIANPAPVAVKADRPVELNRLFLDNPARGRGVGTQLLRTCTTTALCRGHDYCWLNVWDKNVAAIKFYQTNRFNIVGKMTYTDGGMDDTVFVMGRALSAESSGKVPKFRGQFT